MKRVTDRVQKALTHVDVDFFVKLHCELFPAIGECLDLKSEVKPFDRGLPIASQSVVVVNAGADLSLAQSSLSILNIVLVHKLRQLKPKHWQEVALAVVYDQKLKPKRDHLHLVAIRLLVNHF